MWLHFLDDHTADVAFLIGPATLSTPSFQAEGDTVEVNLGVDSIGDSAEIFSGRFSERTMAGPSHAKRCCRFSSGLIFRRRPIHSG